MVLVVLVLVGGGGAGGWWRHDFSCRELVNILTSLCSLTLLLRNY